MPEPFRNNESGYYYVSFCYDGDRYKRTTGSRTLTTAKRRQRIVNGRVEELNAGLTTVPDGVSVADFVFDGKTEPDKAPKIVSLSHLIDDYLEQAAPPSKAESTYATECIHMKHLRKHLSKKKARKIEDLTPRLFESYKRWRHKEGVRNVTINKELSTFRTMLNMAVASGYIKKNPLDAVKWLKEDASFHRFRTGEEIKEVLASGNYSEREEKRIRRCRYLAPEEVSALLELAKGKPLYPVLGVAAYTGMRLSEMLRLRWADVNWKAGQILARGNKGSTTRKESPRHIPMHEELVEILKAQKATGVGPYVLGDARGNPADRDRLYWLIKDMTSGTDFKGVRFHCLRHSFASNLAAQGVDQRVIDRFMGHQTDAMRQRYQHLFPDNKREAIEQLQFTSGD